MADFSDLHIQDLTELYREASMNRRKLVIPHGVWTLPGRRLTIGEGSRIDAVEGESHAGTILINTRIEMKGRGHGAFNQGVKDGRGPLKAGQRWRGGLTVRDLQMIGQGITTGGDSLLVERVTVWDSPFGVQQIPQYAATRESDIVRVHARRCLRGFDFFQPDLPHTDGINNLCFDRCIASYFHQFGFRLVNDPEHDTVREVLWNGGLIHGRSEFEIPELSGPNVLLRGALRDVNIKARFIGSQDEKNSPLVRIEPHRRFRGRRPKRTIIAGTGTIPWRNARIVTDYPDEVDTEDLVINGKGMGDT